MESINNLLAQVLRSKRAGVLKSVGLMGKRAQGMPMEFIVIAVITVLVLLVLVVIFLQGSQTSVIDTQTAINTCDSECLFATQYTKSITRTDLAASNRVFGFCSKTFQIKGMTGDQTCEKIVTCNLIFKDASGCKATCNDGNSVRCS
jgi:hypothetical protein